MKFGCGLTSEGGNVQIGDGCLEFEGEELGIKDNGY